MDITYIANARIPTEKAHGVAIMKACQAFVRAGATAILVLPRRINDISAPAHDFYAVAEKFPIIRLPVIDLVRLRLPHRLWFTIESVSFYISIFFWSLFHSRASIIYTRSVSVIILAFLGYRVVYEMHTRPRHTFFLYALARRAYRVVAISSGLKDDLVRGGVDSSQILVAPSGVDPAVFDIPLSRDDARIALELPPDAYIAVYTGNFTTMGADKGLSDVIVALKQLPDVIFVAVGGSTTDIEYYKKEARDAGVDARVILRGYVPQTELAKYQKAADVLLMPFPDTPHYRTYMSPVKMFEYMLSGRPIIASDLPTIREMLTKEYATIIPPGDPQELADAIKRTALDTVGSKHRVVRAHEHAGQFTWEARSRRILSFTRPVEDSVSA